MQRGWAVAAVSLLLSAFPGCGGCDDDDHDPDPVPPAAPTGLTVASFTSGRVVLTWTDASTNETGFLIERSPDGLVWTAVGTAPADATTFTACGLFPDTLYSFRIRATGSGGSAPTAAVFQMTANVAWGTAATPIPTGRLGHSAIYDPLNRRMILFGGADGTSSLNDTWALDLSGPTPSWDLAALTVSGGLPAPRWLHTAVYDSLRNRMLVFGGDTGTSSIANQNDVWALDLSVVPPAWTPLAPATPQGAPGIRQTHTAVFDDANDRMIVFGGVDATIYDDAWALDVSATADGTWVPLATAPVPRWMHSAIYDSANQQMVVFGGQDAIGRRNDVAALSLPAAAASSSWSTLVSSAASPVPARSSHSAIYDAANCRMVVFGGDSASAPFVSDEVWVLTLLGPPSFSQASPGAGPPGRYGHSAVYDSDPGSERMIIFSGDDGSLAPVDDLAWPLQF